MTILDHHAARDDGRAGRARRSVHDARLLGLERQPQTEEHGGDHVDPEDLQRLDRQRRAEDDAGQDDEPLADVGRQRVGDELDEVVEDAAALLDGGLDGGEVVVGEHHVGGVLGHVGAGDAHGDPDVGLLERRGVVDAVAGHGHDLAPGLQRLDQAELLLRRHAREHVGAVGELDELRVVDGGHLGAGDGAVFGAGGDADVAGDRRRRRGVVAGDHLHADAGVVTRLDGGDRRRPRRVHHRLQAEEREAAGHVVVADVVGAVRRRAAGEGEDAQAVGGQRVHLGVDGGGVQRGRHAGRVQRRRAAREHLLHGALEVHDAPAVAGVVQRRHVLVARSRRGWRPGGAGRRAPPRGRARPWRRS